MNVFLLGNGFDLHFKLPTAYIDFLHTVKFLVDYYDESTMDTVAKVFGDERLKSKCKNIADSYLEYEYFYKEISLPNDMIKNLIEKAKTNIWYQYFSTAIDKELTWIDFEKEIAIVIDCFNKHFDLIDERITEEYQKMVYILLQFSFFLKIDIDDFDWCFFWGVDEVKKDYTIENPIGSELYEIDKEKIIHELYCSLREFADMLKVYLKLFIDSLSNKLHEEDYSMKNNTYPDMHCAFTFNYTNTIEKLYTTEEDVVYHIHGNVDDDIVLGVNPDKYDEFENLDTSFICFKKYFQRVFYKTDVSFIKKISSLYEFRHRATLANRDITVYVIGHSLDETDKDIIQEIFSVATKIVIFYHKVEKVGDYIKNLVAIYGKTGFDALRTSKDIEFLPHQPSELYHS